MALSFLAYSRGLLGHTTKDKEGIHRAHMIPATRIAAEVLSISAGVRIRALAVDLRLAVYPVPLQVQMFIYL